MIPKSMIPKAKDCSCIKLAKDFWDYIVECACCGRDTRYLISKYHPSERYWVINANEDRVAWGKTLSEAKRKAREITARSKARKDVYMAQLRKDHPEYFEPQKKKRKKKSRKKKKGKSSEAFARYLRQ